MTLFGVAATGPEHKPRRGERVPGPVIPDGLAEFEGGRGTIPSFRQCISRECNEITARASILSRTIAVGAKTVCKPPKANPAIAMNYSIGRAHKEQFRSGLLLFVTRICDSRHVALDEERGL